LLKDNPLTSYAIEDDFRNLLAVDSSNAKLLIKISKAPLSGKAWKCGKYNPSVRSDSSLFFNVTDDIRNSIKNETSKELKIRDSAGSNVVALTIRWNPFSRSEATEVSSDNRNNIIRSFEENFSFKKPYDIKKNRIDLYFNESGRLLNFLPVNMDQNDIFYFHIISKTDDTERYRINVIEGLYAPVDLSIKPYDKTITRGQALTGVKPTNYVIVDKQQGPFTTDNFSFQVAFDSLNGQIFNGPAYSLKINKLYHVGIGVSIISTYLENPDFRIAPIDSITNTIESYNTGARALFTINAIWYWNVLNQGIKGNVITGGRDILKDEPSFTFKRVFPTVGVSLDNNFNENFFLGFVYEFARGGSLVAGLHYGKIKELADKNFELNKTPFTGTNDDIRINNVYKPAFFFGINVDTRIFNALVK
jgi:hypothetical protein